MDVPKEKTYRTKVIKNSTKMVISVVPAGKKDKEKKVTSYNFKQGNELQKVGTVHHISAQETILVIIESSD